MAGVFTDGFKSYSVGFIESVPSYKGQYVSRRKTERFRTVQFHPPYPTSQVRWRRHCWSGVQIDAKPSPYPLSDCHPQHYRYFGIPCRLKNCYQGRMVEANAPILLAFHPGFESCRHHRRNPCALVWSRALR